MADDPNPNPNPDPNPNPPPEPIWSKLPENMRGKDAEETLAKLIPSWDGYHKAHTERAAQAPKSADEFKFETKNEKLAVYFKNDKDPLMAAVKNVALEMGLPASKFSPALEKVFGDLVEKGQIAAPVDVLGDYKAKAGMLGHKELTADAKTALQTKETELTSWAENLGKQMKLGETEQIELESLVLTPGGFGLLMKLQDAVAGKGDFKLGGEGAGQQLTKDQVFALKNDERANPLSRKFDKGFADKAEAEFEALRQREAGGKT